LSGRARQRNGRFEGGRANIGVEPEERAPVCDNLDAGAIGREIVPHRAEPKPALCVGSPVIGPIEGFLRFGTDKMSQRARPDD
jgi:hypothetical protein